MKYRILAYLSALVVSMALSGCEEVETYTNLPKIKLSSDVSTEYTSAYVTAYSDFETCEFTNVIYWEGSKPDELMSVDVKETEDSRYAYFEIEGLKPGTLYGYSAHASLYLNGKLVPGGDYWSSGSFITSTPPVSIKTWIEELTDAVAVIGIDYKRGSFILNELEYRKNDTSEWINEELPSSEGSIYVQLMNLEPDTRYYYRFKYTVIIEGVSYPDYYSGEYSFQTRPTSLPLKIDNIYCQSPWPPGMLDKYTVYKYDRNGQIVNHPIECVRQGDGFILSEEILIEPGSYVNLAFIWPYSSISPSVTPYEPLFYTKVRADYGESLSVYLYDMMSYVEAEVTSDLSGTFGIDLISTGNGNANMATFDMNQGNFTNMSWNDKYQLGAIVSGSEKFDPSQGKNNVVYRTLPQETASACFRIHTPTLGDIDVKIPSDYWKRYSDYRYYIHIYRDGSYVIRLNNAIEPNVVEVDGNYVYPWEYGGSEDIIIK